MPEDKPSRLGRYELNEILGQGAMGVVYKAYDSFLDRTVAVKTYRQDVPLFQQARERFEREVRTASRLTHPNIVTVYDGGLEAGVPYLAMELIEGPTLRDELSSRGRLPRDEALGIFYGIADALAYAHGRGVVHRDLKPANILIATNGVAKISDFGVAKVLDPANSAKTQTIGTPGYMAPEQIQGKDIGPATDVFALGILAYELLTGARPFEAPSAITLFYQILHSEPRPPTEVDPSLPKAVDRVIGRALAKKSADRTPDAATFARELREALGTSTAPPASVAAPRPATNVAPWIGTAIAVLVVVTAAVLRFGGWHEEPAPNVVAIAESTPTPAQPPAAAIVEPTVAAMLSPTAEPTMEPTVHEAPSPQPEVAATSAPQAPPTHAPPIAKPTAARARPATIDVASDPPGADVLVDGVREGQTPLRLSRAAAANVLLEVRKPGFSPYYKSLRVERGSQYKVRARLNADPRGKSWVTVVSQPPGAKIVLEGAPAGSAPVRLGPLAPGRYKIDAEYRGFPTASKTIDLQPGEIFKVSFIFEPASRR